MFLPLKKKKGRGVHILSKMESPIPFSLVPLLQSLHDLIIHKDLQSK